ncbi:hypothetical protein [Glycomyces tarimensis]
MSDELASIEPETLNSYLERRNWSRQGTRRGAIIWQAAGSGKSDTAMRLLVPPARVFSDDDELVVEAIHKLAKWEERDVSEVLDELANPSTDMQIFRTHPPSEPGIISLDGGFKSLQAIHDLIKNAGRRVAEGDQLQYQGARPKVVSRFLEDVELLPTKPGSYVFMTRMNLLHEISSQSPQPSDRESSEEIADISNLLAAQELRREIVAVNKIARERLEGGDIADPTELRVSVNACKALADLGGPDHDRPFEIEFVSGFASRISKPDTEVSFTAAIVGEVYKFRGELEELARTGSATIEGKVESLERRPGEYPRVKIVGDRLLKGSRRRGALWVIVDDADYHRAYEAQRQGLQVRASGELTWMKRRMELRLGINDLEILRNSSQS